MRWSIKSDTIRWCYHAYRVSDSIRSTLLSSGLCASPKKYCPHKPTPKSYSSWCQPWSHLNQVPLTNSSLILPLCLLSLNPAWCEWNLTHSNMWKTLFFFPPKAYSLDGSEPFPWEWQETSDRDTICPPYRKSCFQAMRTLQLFKRKSHLTRQDEPVFSSSLLCKVLKISKQLLLRQTHGQNHTA